MAKIYSPDDINVNTFTPDRIHRRLSDPGDYQSTNFDRPNVTRYLHNEPSRQVVSIDELQLSQNVVQLLDDNIRKQMLGIIQQQIALRVTEGTVPNEVESANIRGRKDVSPSRGDALVVFGVDSQVCPICHEQVQTLAVLSCNHGFCASCVEAWIPKAGTCSMCRQPVTDIQFFRLQTPSLKDGLGDTLMTLQRSFIGMDHCVPRGTGSTQTESGLYVTHQTMTLPSLGEIEQVTFNAVLQNMVPSKRGIIKVVDMSGSMGPSLVTVPHDIHRGLNALPVDETLVSWIGFGSTAQVFVGEDGPVAPNHPSVDLAATLTGCLGGTNLPDGLYKAKELVQGFIDMGVIPVIDVLTDGQTDGIPEAASLIQDLNEMGVQVFVWGYGPSYSFDLCNKLVNPTQFTDATVKGIDIAKLVSGEVDTMNLEIIADSIQIDGSTFTGKHIVHITPMSPMTVLTKGLIDCRLLQGTCQLPVFMTNAGIASPGDVAHASQVLYIELIQGFLNRLLVDQTTAIADRLVQAQVLKRFITRDALGMTYDTILTSHEMMITMLSQELDDTFQYGVTCSPLMRCEPSRSMSSVVATTLRQTSMMARMASAS
jgi:hypothetical protein